jgi:Transglycosylase SLT domain
MLVEPGNAAAGSTVTGAIRQASAATGTSFSYLLATAQVESGLNPQAGASTSSARGLFQFVEQTWLGTIKQSGAALGYGRYAAAITRTASGHYVVKDPTMRREILKLRNDPTANAVMAGAFTQTNAAYLTQKLGRPPSEGELYIAHFLGAGGAARLIGLAASNPSAKATDFFAGAAHANRSIFFDKQTGAARSVAAVRNVLTARYDVARFEPHNGTASAAAAPAAPQAANVAAPLSIVPDTAGIANAFAAAVPLPAQPSAQMPQMPLQVSAQMPAAPHDQMFHGLFSDAGSSGPVGPLVSQLWGVPDAAPNLSGAAPAANDAGGVLLDLFRDSGTKS